MAVKGSRQDLNKQFVLDRVSEEELWNKYFTVDFNRNFKSPLRNDKKETCAMFESTSGSWWMKDYNGSFCGSVFDALMVSTRLDFYNVLEKIVKDLNLHGVSRINHNNISADRNNLPKQKRVIRIKSRAWEDYDIEYWNQYGIDVPTLERFHVVPTQMVWMDNKITGELEVKLINNKLNPIYAYRFDPMCYKIYLPKGGDFRWICNTSILQGKKQLPKTGELLILSKSLKDIMTLYKCGYNAVAIQGEGHDFPEDEFNELKLRFKRIVVWYDQDWDKEDNVGRRCAKKVADKYGIEQIEIPIEYKIKDPSDFVVSHGIDNLKILINKLINI